MIAFPCGRYYCWRHTVPKLTADGYPNILINKKIKNKELKEIKKKLKLRKLKTSKFHIWVYIGNQFRDSVTRPFIFTPDRLA